MGLGGEGGGGAQLKRVKPKNMTSSGTVESSLQMAPLWGQRAQQGQCYSNKVTVEDKLINAFM